MSVRSNDVRVTREAADWFMELQTEGENCHAAFTEWLRRSPEHVEEFLAITGVSLKLEGIDPLKQVDVEALLRDVETNVLTLPHLTPTPAGRREGKRIWLAAACVAATVIAGFIWMTPQPETYITRIGEQRAFKLPDGSLIHLNTQSRAEVRFSDTMREIRLLGGEALFSVERDPSRPFRVVSGTTTVQVLGTEFNVYRSPAGDTTVSVVAGAVQVTSASLGAKAPTRLEAGERADVHAGTIAKNIVPDVPSVTAWRQRQLVFRDKPLADVVAQFNRYNTVQFEVEPAAGHEPLSGVFAADRPESFVLFLEKDKSVRVERTGNRLIIHPR